MASGDTKTQQYLDIAANGSRSDLPADTCCNTRTQDLILDVAERIITEEETRAREDAILQDEIDEIKNNPDVFDIVDTYADLQAYDTQHLTDKDIIRVLSDETHEGASTYYRWDKHNEEWEYIGSIINDVTILTPDDYNYPANDPTSIALWLLEPGIYRSTDGAVVSTTMFETILTGTLFFVGDGGPGITNYWVIGQGSAAGTSGSDLLQYFVVEDGAVIYRTSALTKNEVVDSLVSTATDRPLSANQGKVLKDLVDGLVGDVASALNVINNGTGA